MPAWPLLVALALQADPRAQLEALRARKAQEEAAARALQQREGSLLGAVDAAEEGWARAAAAARAAEAGRAAASERLASARAAEAAAQASSVSLQAMLAPRLRAQARIGALTTLRLLATSDSLADLVKRSRLWRWVLANDLSLLEDSRAAVARRATARAAVERESAALSALASAAAEHREAAAARRSEHRALLGAIRSERSLHERAAAEAASQERRLADFVAALPPAGAGTPLHAGFALLRGKLPLPVGGTVAVGFGPVVNPRFNTVTVQKGIDIRAEPGAQVRAVAPGRVAHAGWFKGYGNLVIVDHGEGFHTLVAHLASMSTAQGEEVVVGSPLGTVADGGSPLGPYLYFEIRERGRPVDPREWLRP